MGPEVGLVIVGRDLQSPSCEMMFCYRPLGSQGQNEAMLKVMSDNLHADRVGTSPRIGGAIHGTIRTQFLAPFPLALYVWKTGICPWRGSTTRQGHSVSG